MLRTSSSTDLLISAAQIVVEFDWLDVSGGAIGKLVKKSSKSRKIVKKSKKPQRSEKFAKAIGSEKTFTKVPVLRQQRTRALVKALTVF